MASRRRLKKDDGTQSTNNKRSRKAIDLAWSGDGGADDELIDSDNESDDDNTPSYKNEDEDESDEEDLDAKKVRLARQYLDQIEQESDSDSSADEDSDKDDTPTGDAIARRLQKQRLKREGIFERPMASNLDKSLSAIHDKIAKSQQLKGVTFPNAEVSSAAWIDEGYVSVLKGHDLTPTCMSLQASGEKAVSGSKDHSVILWDIEKECRINYLVSTWKKSSVSDKHNQQQNDRTRGEVLSVACSDDGRYAAVGKRDSTVSIFDIRSKNESSSNLVKVFDNHKSAVTCLTFRTHSNQLFSGSDDRIIRHYSLDEMMCMETLFGHQFGVTSIDCHRRERPVSVSSDRTARAWKLQEDTHLIFRGGAKSQAADCVTLIKDDWFVSGHQDGLLSLWTTGKKRSVANVTNAHGTEGNLGRSIVCVDSLKGSDVAVTGSDDGYLRFWRANTGREMQHQCLQTLVNIPLYGFINAVQFGPKGRFCVAAVGQEHRMGRWKRIAQAKNRIVIVKLEDSPDDDNSGNSSEDVDNGDVKAGARVEADDDDSVSDASSP
jgi:ribosomal RNA-processing protein 9